MYDSSAPKPNVPWWTGPSAFALVVLLLFVFSLVLRILMSVYDPQAVAAALGSPQSMIIQVLVMSAVFSFLAAAVPSVFRVSPSQWLHLSKVSPRVVIAAAVGVTGLGFWVDELVFLLHSIDPVFFDASGLDTFNRLFISAPSAVFVLLSVAVTLGPGIGEELFFRGLVLRSLVGAASPAAAVGISSILFGIVHFDVLQSPGAALIGVYLGTVALRTGSLLPSMAAHGINNLTCALFARFSDPTAPTPVDVGHPIPLLAAAAAVFAVASVLLFRWTDSGPPDDPKIPPQGRDLSR